MRHRGPGAAGRQGTSRSTTRACTARVQRSDFANHADGIVLTTFVSFEVNQWRRSTRIPEVANTRGERSCTTRVFLNPEARVGRHARGNQVSAKDPLANGVRQLFHVDNVAPSHFPTSSP